KVTALLLGQAGLAAQQIKDWPGRCQRLKVDRLLVLKQANTHDGCLFAMERKNANWEGATTSRQACPGGINPPARFPSITHQRLRILVQKTYRAFRLALPPKKVKIWVLCWNRLGRAA